MRLSRPGLGQVFSLVKVVALRFQVQRRFKRMEIEVPMPGLLLKLKIQMEKWQGTYSKEIHAVYNAQKSNKSTERNM